MSDVLVYQWDFTNSTPETLFTAKNTPGAGLFPLAAGANGYGGTADLTGLVNPVAESNYRTGFYWLSNGATVDSATLPSLTNGKNYKLRCHFFGPPPLVGTFNVTTLNVDGGTNVTGTVPSGGGKILEILFTASGISAVLNYASNTAEKFFSALQLYEIITNISITSLTVPTPSINTGDDATPTVTPANGSGTKVYLWKVGGSGGATVTGATTATPTISHTYLSNGDNTLYCKITDDTGFAESTVNIFVGEITGLSPTGNATETYSTNVPSPVWSKVSGLGSIDASTGVFTKPTTGSGSTVIKATKSGDSTRYATRTISWYAVVDASFTAPTSIASGASFPITDATIGGSGTKTYEFKFNGLTVAPSSSGGGVYNFAGLGAGAYTVRMTVTDDTGTDYFEQSLFVGSISGPSYVQNGLTAAFTTDVPSPVWSITANTSPASSIDPATGVVTGGASGTGSITIKAQKSTDAAVYATKTISLVQVLTAAFTYSASLVIGSNQSLTNTSSGGIGSKTYEWFYDGDDEPFATTANASIVAPAIGTHTVKLRAEDSDGNVDEETHTFVVTNIQLTSTNNSSGATAPATVVFTDTTAGTVSDQMWEYGDGVTFTKAGSGGATHIYLAPGTYNVRRTALVNGYPALEEFSVTIGGSATVATGTNIEFDEIELPRHYSEGAKGGPEHLTTKFDSPPGMQQRNVSRYDPIHKFEIFYEAERENAIFKELLAFRFALHGPAVGFRFFPPYDNSWTDEEIAKTVTGTAVYKFYRTYKVAGREYKRRIIKPIPDLVVKINGALASTVSAYTIDYTRGTITFASPGSLPTNGSLTLTGFYHIPMLFEEDLFSATNFTTYLDVDSLKLVEILPAALGIE
jgi:uncharacterized protein (TIGR02217 family)